jgi:hypothetical protein
MRELAEVRQREPAEVRVLEVAEARIRVRVRALEPA